METFNYVPVYGVIVPAAKAKGRELLSDIVNPEGKILAYAGTKPGRLDCWVFRRCFGVTDVVVRESPRVCKKFANRRSAAVRARNRTL